MRTLPALLALVAASLALSAAAHAHEGDAHAETRSVEVLLHDRLHIAPETISAALGDTLELGVTVPADQQGGHDLFVEGYELHTPVLSPGSRVPATLVLDRAGTFAYWCTVPGHKEGGMVGTLVVAGGAKEDATPAAGGALAAAALAVAAALTSRATGRTGRAGGSARTRRPR